MRALPWLLVGCLIWGCASIHGSAEGPPPGASLLVRQALEADDSSRVVFLPADLLDSVLEDWSQEPSLAEGYSVWFVEGLEPDAAIEPTTARRTPRGSGPLVRRPSGPKLRANPPLWRSDPLPPATTARAVQQARQLYYRRLEEAKLRYPKHHGYHNHHAVPIYLGGPANGMTYRIPAAYHEAITQRFRKRWGYSRAQKPDPKELMEILIDVYSEYPIPQLIGISP